MGRRTDDFTVNWTVLVTSVLGVQCKPYHQQSTFGDLQICLSTQQCIADDNRRGGTQFCDTFHASSGSAHTTATAPPTQHKRSIEPLLPTRSATINNATDPNKLCWLDCSQLATGCNMEPTQTTPLTTLHCQIHTFSSRHYLRTETLSWEITGQIISHLSNWKRSGDLQSIVHCFACVMLAEIAPIALWCWPYNGFNYLIFCETLNE